MIKKILFSLVLVLGLSINLYAQNSNEQKGLVYKISDFSGGLNSKISSLNTPPNQATICENARFDSELQSLTKRSPITLYGGSSDSDFVTGLHRFYGTNGTQTLIRTLGSSVSIGNDSTGSFTSILTLSVPNHYFQWKNWHNLAIGTDGYNNPIKYDGSSASATYLGTCLALDSGSGTGPNGTYTYKISFYTTGEEVSLGTASNTIVVTNHAISLSLIPIGPDSFDGSPVLGRKVYRILNGGSTYKLVTTISDNFTTTYTDSVSDATLTNNASLSPTYTYAPPKGRFIEVNANRIWLANNPNYPSRIYYSDSASHDYFDPLAYFDIRPADGDEITFFKNQLGIATIGKTNTIEKIYTEGTDPFVDWSISDPFSFKGCRASYTACNSPLGIIYLSNDGIYAFDGQSSHLISDAVRPVIDDISPSNFPTCYGAFHKSIYYLTYPSKATGLSANNRVLTFDLLSNAYNIDLLSVGPMCSFNSGSDWDLLYLSSSGNGSVYAQSNPSYQIVHNKFSDFTGTWTESRYIPTLVGGDSNSPVIEIARTGTIGDMVGTIGAQVGVIGRDTTSGNYISQVLQTKATKFDKAYWNPILPLTGGSVSLEIRTGATATPDGSWSAWSSAFTNPNGSDISGVTTNTYFQYKILMTTSDIHYTPNLVLGNGYVVKITYSITGAIAESSVSFHWTSGYSDFGYPVNDKVLRKVEVYLSGTSGNLQMTVSSYAGPGVGSAQAPSRSNVFNIDLSQNQTYYAGYFTSGGMRGREFNIDLQNNDLNNLVIKKIVITFDEEPSQ